MITGTIAVGETVTADTSGISDSDGLTNVQYSFQWVRSSAGTDTNIAGAAAATYTIATDDVGNALKVQATFLDDGGNPESLISAATDVLSAAIQAASEEGELVVGSYGVQGTLTADDTGDSYTISLEAGKRYRVDVLVDAYHDVGYGGTYSGKPVVEVLAADSTISDKLQRINGFGDQDTPTDTSAVTNKGDGPDNAARSDFDVSETGTYRIVVKRGDDTSSGSYTVRVSDITSEQAYGEFTSGFNGGRLKIDDANPMTGTVGRTGDIDWYVVLLEEGKCYTFHAKGQHSDPAHNGGTLQDPEISLSKFYDYYEKQYYDPVTKDYVDPDPLPYDTFYMDPDGIEFLSGTTSRCSAVDVSGESKTYCSEYCDDNSGEGNNAQLQVSVGTGGGGEYLIGVESANRSVGTYSVYVEETTCPSN